MKSGKALWGALLHKRGRKEVWPLVQPSPSVTIQQGWKLDKVTGKQVPKFRNIDDESENGTNMTADVREKIETQGTDATVGLAKCWKCAICFVTRQVTIHLD